MSKFTDLFQEPIQTPASTPEPVKVLEVVVEKPVVENKTPEKKITTN